MDDSDAFASAQVGPLASAAGDPATVAVPTAGAAVPTAGAAPTLAPTPGEVPASALASAEAGEARAGSTTTRALARAGLIVTVLFFASRVLGYVRTIAIAAAVPDVGSPS